MNENRFYRWFDTPELNIPKVYYIDLKIASMPSLLVLDPLMQLLNFMKILNNDFVKDVNLVNFLHSVFYF